MRSDAAYSFIASGRYDEALRLFIELVGEMNDYSSHRGLVIVYLRQKKWEKVRESLERAMKVCDDYRLVIALSRALSFSPDEVILSGARAVQLAENVRARRHITSEETYAMALAESGYFDKAIRIQEEILGSEQFSNFKKSEKDVSMKRYKTYVLKNPWRLESEDEIIDVLYI